ncbi:MAG: hypothetical protein ACH346_06795 [Chthoniobacterales bacterium]
MREHWDSNTTRSEARAKADRLAQDLEEAKEDLISLAENQRPLDPTWQSRNRITTDHFDQMQAAASEAQKNWLLLAKLEPSVKTASNREEKNSLLTKLQEKDQAVVARWEKARENFYQEQDYESRRAQKARLTQENGAYKFDLITEKNNTLATCFAEADALKNKAQEKYRRRIIPQNKIRLLSKLASVDEMQGAHGAQKSEHIDICDASSTGATQQVATEVEFRKKSIDAEQLYGAANALEQGALARYAEMTLSEALKAARENIPGAEVAWEFRKQKSQRDYQAAQAKIAASQVLEPPATMAIEDTWADEDQKTALRLRGIAEADSNAFEAFQREAKEFANLEATWMVQLAREEKEGLIKKIAASKNYLQGDPSAWNALPHQEREAYNEAVSTANEMAIDIAERDMRE